MGVAAVKLKEARERTVENDLATMKSDIKYINIGIADIKTDFRTFDPKIERLHGKLDDIKETLSSEIRVAEDTAIEKVDMLKDALIKKTDEIKDSLTRRIDEVREALTAKIDDVKGSVVASDMRMERQFAEVRASIASAKLWALGLYITLAAGLLGILARGFGWI